MKSVLETLPDLQYQTAPPTSPKPTNFAQVPTRLMLMNRKPANKTPEPRTAGVGTEGTPEEDVYNFIKRERASQKDLNSSQLKIQDRAGSRRQRNSVNHSQDLQ